MYYCEASLWDNARWYDPALGRFAQADSIVPPGVQGLDRYAYVNNNPMRYTDPTGHVTEKALYFDSDGTLPLATYGVFIEGNLSSDTLLAASSSVRDIAKALGKESGRDSVSSFKEKFGGNVGIRRWASDGCKCAADVWVNPDEQRYEVRIFNDQWTGNHPELLIHELGHIYYNLNHDEFTSMGYSLRRPDYGNIENEYHGFSDGQYKGQFAVVYLDYDTEIFADMFLGWVYDRWTYNAPGHPGEARKDWMSVNMASSDYGDLNDR